MLVDGAILPPRAALEAVAEVVRAVPVPADPGAPPEAKGLRARLGLGRGRSAEPDPPPEMLDHLPLGRIQLLVTEFGNLTTPAAHGLAAEMAAAASSWRTPIDRFAGGTALDFPGDWSVWAKLDGDVEELATIARGVTETAQRLGLFVDRRLFRPMVPIATVTPATTGPYLQAVVDALDAFRGEEWPVELSLTKETFVSGQPEWTEFQRIPLDG